MRWFALFAVLVGLVLSSSTAVGQPAPGSISYGYDDAGRLAVVIDPSQSNGVAAYGYDKNGNLTSVARSSTAGSHVSWVSPQKGVVGAFETIYGTGFDPTPANDTVKFGGVTAATPLLATQTQLQVIVPSGAATGTISVTVAGSSASSSQTFTVVNPAAPVVSSFSPAVIDSTSRSLSISGSNFSSSHDDNVVAADHTRMDVSSASGTSLTGQIDGNLGVGSGPITVATPNGTGTSSSTLWVAPSGTVAANVDTSSSGTMSVGSSRTVSITPTTVPDVSITTFQGTDGQRIFIDLTNITGFPCTSGCTTVELIDPQGHVVASVVPQIQTFIDTQSTMSGWYSIVLIQHDAGTGSASLKISLNAVPADPSTPIAADGSTHTLSNTAPGQNMNATFAGTAGQRVSLQVSNFSSLGCDGGSFCLTASLVSPSGVVIGSITPPINGFLDTTTLPSNGTYTVRLDPGGDTVGSADLQVWTVTADITQPITLSGSSDTFGLTTPGMNGYATFSGTAGQKITANFTPSGSTITDTLVSVVRVSDGVTVASTDVFFSNGSLNATLPTNDNYEIKLDPQGAYAGTIVAALVPGTFGPMKPGKSANSGSARHSSSPTDPTSATAARAAGTGASSTPKSGTASHSKIWSPTGRSPSTKRPRVTRGEGAPVTAAWRQAVSREASQAWEAKRRAAETVHELPEEFFRTTPLAAWRPDTVNSEQNWETGYPAAPLTDLPALQGPTGRNSLSGQVLALDGAPLKNVTLSIGAIKTETDSTGRFVLTGVPAGGDDLVINGASADRRGASYGVFEDGVRVRAARTTQLPYTIWMPRLDTQHEVHFSYPLRHQLVVSTPQIPGLKVVIPAGSVIRDMQGHRVHELGITPIPTDRPPVPLPSGVSVPIYFTVQPGSSYVMPKGARIIYPNYTHLPAGTRVDFWDYNPDHDKGWYVYGKGTVTSSARSVIPDRGVRVWEFTGAMITDPLNLGPIEHAIHDFTKWFQRGDPVDPASGLLDMETTDMYEPGLDPIEVTRSYRQNDYTVSGGSPAVRAFGVGQNWNYGIFLEHVNSANQSVDGQYDYVDLVLPDGSLIHYVRTSSCSNGTNPCTSWTDAVLTAESTPSEYLGTTIAWDATNDGWDLRMHDGSMMFFGEHKPLQWIEDANGNVTRIFYVGQGSSSQGDGEVAEVISPSGRWLKFSYNSANCPTCVSSVVDQSGRATTYTYNASSQLTQVKDADLNLTKYGWSSTAGATDEMLNATDPRGNKYLVNTYDANHRVTKQAFIDGSSAKFAYTLSGNSVTQTNYTDPDGTVTVFKMTNGYVTTETDSNNNASYKATTTITRDPTTNLVASEKQPLTSSTTRTTAYTYQPDESGQSYGSPEVASVTYLSGTSNALTVNYQNTTVPAEGIAPAIIGDGVTSITDPRTGKSWTYGYDGDQNLTSATNPLNQTDSLSYNLRGLLTSSTEPGTGGPAMTTTYGYLLGDPNSDISPEGEASSAFTDSAGQVIETSNALGETATYAYDALNNLTSVSDALGNSTVFGYDPDGDLTSIQDPRNNTTKLTYDTMDRLSTRVDTAPTPRTESFGYDSDGNLTSWTDRNGVTTGFAYDPIDRLEQVCFTQSGSTCSSTITASYDLANRLTGLSDTLSPDPSGSVVYTYDGMNNPLTETTTPTGGSAARGTITYTYYADSLEHTMTVAGQPQVTYAYTDANQLSSITQATRTAGFTYDNAGRESVETLPDGDTQTYSYDQDSDPISIAYAHSGTTLGQIDYSYLPDGSVDSEGNSFARTNLPQSFSANYDSADRITTATVNGTFYTYSYDADGQLQSDGVNTYSWSARHELGSVAHAGTTIASYIYDPLGRRVQAALGATTTRYLYDDGNVVQEQDGTSSYTPTANLLEGFDDDQYLTRTLANGTERDFLTDGLGSTIALADAAGTVQTSYTYDPYGGDVSTSGAADSNPFQYEGRPNDGLPVMFSGSRYYDPTTASFVSEDVLALVGQAASPYPYTFDDPTNYTDPTGYWPLGGVKPPSDPRTGNLPGPPWDLPGTGSGTGCDGAYVLCAGTGKDNGDGEPETPEEMQQRVLRDGENLLGSGHSKAARDRWLDWWKSLSGAEKKAYNKGKGPKPRKRN